jgi:membrane protease subunit HflC
MSPKQTLFVLFTLVLVVVGSNSLFVVDEWETGIVLRFGKIHGIEETGTATEYKPGLHFMIPFVDRVVKIDKRIQTMDSRPQEALTNEKKALVVDTYVKWRVSDYGQFYLRTQNDFNRAESLLERIVNNDLRAAIGMNTVKETISGEREQMMIDIGNNSNASAQELGINVVDVRVKQVNYPPEVSENVYERMRSERERVATAFRSNGRKEADIIEASADKEATIIEANAERDSKIIRGEADAKAAAIYAEAFKQDAEFFAFLRSLESYEKSFIGQQDIMVMRPDSDFFKFIKDIDGKQD